MKVNSSPTKKKRTKISSKSAINKKRNTIIVKNNLQIKIGSFKNSYSNSHMYIDSNENIKKINNSKSEHAQKTDSFSDKKLIKNNIDYNELSYEQALKKDERNILQIFISLFNIKLEFIQIIFYPKQFSHHSLTISIIFI